jgi:hypothetical protein
MIATSNPVPTFSSHRSPHNLRHILPPSVYSIENSIEAKLILMVVLEHLMFLLKYSLNLLLVDDEPVLSSHPRALATGSAYESQQPGARSENGNFTPPKSISKSSSSSSSSSPVSRQCSAEPSAGRTNASPEMQDTSIIQDPMFFMSAFVIAPLLNAVGVSTWWYLPAAAMVTTYFLLKRDKEAERMAAALSCDERAIKYLMNGYLPPWISSSSFERVDWLNSTLQKLWPFLGLALSRTVCGAVNPILAGVCESVPILKMLVIHEMSFGEIAPTINSVRFDVTQESLVRLDLSITWPSKLFAVLKVRLAGTPLPLTIDLKNVLLKCVLRLELLEFTDAGLACFKVLTISFTDDPKLSFSIKLSKMDIMNIGVGKGES